MPEARECVTPDLIVIGRTRRADNTWRRGEVWVSGEKFVAVHDQPQDRAVAHAATRIDVGEALVMPGAVDSHVHSLSHRNEGFRAATASAAAGGVTTIVEMPFDGTGPINNRDRLLAKQDLAHDEAIIDVALLGTMAPDGGWREAERLAENGVVGFKVSLFMTDPVRFPRIDDFQLLSVMRAAADTGRTLCTHAENNEIVSSLLKVERRSNPIDPQAHSRSRPPISETLGVLTALEIAAECGNALHVCHLSLPRSIDLVSWYQDQGVDVTLETCPHYLTFTEDDLQVQRGRLKINPPLRSSADRAELWNRLESGAISIVSSDHAPWPAEIKDNERIFDNASGAPGVENLVAVTLGQAIGRDPSLRTLGDIVDSLTIAPARRFGLDHRKGSIEVGKDADLMIFAPDASAIIDASAQHTNAGWSPYDGMRPGGVVTHTIARGDIVWMHEAGLLGRTGRGQVVTRDDN